MVSTISDSKCLSIFFLLLLSGALPLASQPVEGSSTYIVKPGDSLTYIASDFGYIVWWTAIYEANKDKIDDPNVIYPGQELTIPSYIVSQSYLMHNLNKTAAMEGGHEGRKTAQNTQKKEKLEKFREAFKDVVSQKEKKENKNENVAYEGLGFGGMVLDETRSKMGSNFYSVFYEYWETPQNAQNYTVTISEQPVPSRGTLVEIKINDQLVFRNRLESSFYKIEKTAKQAVAICQQRLQQQATIQNKFAGY